MASQTLTISSQSVQNSINQNLALSPSKGQEIIIPPLLPLLNGWVRTEEKDKDRYQRRTKAWLEQ